MTTEALKSTAITNLDATPALFSTSGEGAQGVLRSISATITPTSGVTSGSTYKMCRIPVNAKLKHIYVQGAAQTQGSYDVRLYYSDSTVDGTAVANQGLDATSLAFFVAAKDFSSTVAMTDVAFLNTSGYLITDANTPLWKATNSTITADPGGFFDIVLKNTNTITTGAAMFLEVQYVM